MSDDVNIHIWEEPNTQVEGLQIFANVLECVAVPQHSDEGRLLTRFEQLRVYETSFSNVVLDEAIRTNDVSKVLSRLERHRGPRVHYEITSAYDCFHLEPQTGKMKPWIKPLTINYFGRDYGRQGLEYKSYGPVRLDFSNTKAFRVPQSLIDDVKQLAEGGSDTSEALRTIAQLGRNFDAVSRVAKRVIQKLNPTHLLICTELEVHPLTAHAIYHRDWQDFANDLEKIARLHEYGGVYFCDVAPDDPAFREPRKSPPDYGYLRGEYASRTEDEFVETLQPIVHAILRHPERIAVFRDQIEDSFQGLPSTEIERLNDSYYLSVIDSPFDYLEEPYFSLSKTLQLL